MLLNAELPGARSWTGVRSNDAKGSNRWRRKPDPASLQVVGLIAVLACITLLQAIIVFGLVGVPLK